MLNELYQLSEALKNAGITPPNRHPKFKELPNASNKNPCFKIILGAEGIVTDIQAVSLDLAQQLRKWEPNNGDSFPGFNIQPVYRVADEACNKLLKRWREGKAPLDLALLKTWCKNTNRNWNENSANKSRKCLQQVSQKLLELLGEIPDEFEVIRKVVCRASRLKVPIALEEYVWARLEARKDISTLLPILVHEGSASQIPDEDRGSLSVFIDVQDWASYPVAHEKTMQFLNERLLLQRSSKMAVASVTDAYGLQLSVGDNDEKLPEVKLPIIGGVKLRSMFKASACQYRYKTIEAASFPIGQESQRRAQGALEWLSNRQREGQTWGHAYGKELLFAYPANVPPSPPKLAACLGARKEDDKSARFAEYARDVIVQLKGINKDLKQVEIHVFSLRKMDKARTKVVFHRNYSAERLATAAADWQTGCDNIPAIRISAWGDNKGEAIVATPEAPFPLQIAGCLNRVWKMEVGNEKEDKDRGKPVLVDIIRPTLGVELLLDAKDSRYISRLLSITIQNGKGLFISLGNAMHKDERISLKGSDKQKQWMTAILGLLLHKGGIEKECYMMNAPYLIGNMLKVSDDLHRLYCNKVRGGKLPPQLLGNALMVAALESPMQAISLLSKRIMPYLAWAKTNSTDVAGLSRYFIKCYGEIEAKLRGQTLPTRLNDAERAQLFLGYLASSEKADSNNEQGKGE